MYRPELIDLLLTSSFIAIWAYVFIRLQEAGQVLQWLPNTLAYIMSGGRVWAKGLDPYGPALVIWKWFTCSTCHAGIVAVGYCLINQIEIKTAFLTVILSIFINLKIQNHG